MQFAFYWVRQYLTPTPISEYWPNICPVVCFLLRINHLFKQWYKQETLLTNLLIYSLLHIFSSVQHNSQIFLYFNVLYSFLIYHYANIFFCIYCRRLHFIFIFPLSQIFSPQYDTASYSIVANISAKQISSNNLRIFTYCLLFLFPPANLLSLYTDHIHTKHVSCSN